jgi:hypothetical protein
VRHGGVPLLRNELGRIVGRQFVHQEKIGSGEDVAQKLDALADERSDGAHFLRRNWESGRVCNREQATAELVDRERADVFGIEPQRFGIEGLVRRGGGLLEIHHRVRAIDAFQRERVGEFLTRHVLAIIFWRPAQQAQKIDESFRQKSGVAISGDADHRAMSALGELRPVRRDQQRKMRELRRLGPGALKN